MTDEESLGALLLRIRHVCVQDHMAANGREVLRVPRIEMQRSMGRKSMASLATAQVRRRLLPPTSHHPTLCALHFGVSGSGSRVQG